MEITKNNSPQIIIDHAGLSIIPVHLGGYDFPVSCESRSIESAPASNKASTICHR